jgi:hypothetical protein
MARSTISLTANCGEDSLSCGAAMVNKKVDVKHGLLLLREKPIITKVESDQEETHSNSERKMY